MAVTQNGVKVLGPKGVGGFDNGRYQTFAASGTILPSTSYVYVSAASTITLPDPVTKTAATDADSTTRVPDGKVIYITAADTIAATVAVAGAGVLSKSNTAGAASNANKIIKGLQNVACVWNEARLTWSIGCTTT